MSGLEYKHQVRGWVAQMEILLALRHRIERWEKGEITIEDERVTVIRQQIASIEQKLRSRKRLIKSQAEELGTQVAELERVAG